MLQLRRHGLCATARAARCARATGWIEILGAGMVDPNVFAYVGDDGYDPERSRASPSAWASSASPMLKHGIPDLRLLYDNDLRFLEQFG